MAEITPRQLEAVVAYLETGSVKGAAHRLGVSFHTIEGHLVRARAGARVDTTGQLIFVLTIQGHLAPHRIAVAEPCAIVDDRFRV